MYTHDGYPVEVDVDSQGRRRMRPDIHGQDRFDPGASFRLPPTSCRAMDRQGVVCSVLGTTRDWNRAREEGWFVAMPAGVYMSREGYMQFLNLQKAMTGNAH